MVAKHFIAGDEKIEAFWDEPIERKKSRIGLFLCEIALADQTVRKTISLDCSEFTADENDDAEAAAKASKPSSKKAMSDLPDG